jgi:hypothetical protein
MDNPMNTPKYSVKDVLVLAIDSGLPKASVIALVNELMNPQSRLLGNEEPTSKEAMLKVMHDVGFTEYDGEIGLKEGGKRKKATRRAIRRNKRM